MPDPTTTLPPQLATYRRGFLDRRDEARDLSDGVDPARLAVVPDDESWSVAQIFDHMNTAGWLLLNEIEREIGDARDDGPFGEPPFEYGFISQWFVRSMKPSSGWTFTAPSLYEPESSATLHPDEAVQEFVALQEDFANCLPMTHGLDLRRIRISSPAVPLLRISLGAWFEATLAHERRHLQQARDVLDRVRG